MPAIPHRADMPNQRWVSYVDGSTKPFGEDNPPAETPVGYGFNTWASYNAYTNSVNESSTEMLTRLTTDYGPFKYTKSFLGGSTFLPSSFSSLNPETKLNNPADVFIVCCGWTLGTIANGSKDAGLTSFAASIPAGKTVILTWNECDAPGRISNWTTYKADMDHAYDLAETLNETNAGRLEVMDCFMVFALESASGPRWQDSWTNAAKRHGIIWDHYWNRHNHDASGNEACGLMETVMNRLGYTRWILGEWGDRRPGTEGASVPNDSERAIRAAVHLERLLACSPRPEGLVYFNTIGTTGDHRILRPPYGNDDATYNVLKTYMETAQ